MSSIRTTLLVSAALTLFGVFSYSFGRSQDRATQLKVGAALTPHAEILSFIQPRLREQCIELSIVTLDDETQLNPALAEHAIDANYFQHAPFLQAMAKEKGYAFTLAGTVHVEPIGFYSTKVKTKEGLKVGASIGLPNDPSNEHRALVLLETQGLIKLKPGLKAFSATPRDIAENPRQFKFVEVDVAQLPRALPDLDGAVIHTSLALEAKLDLQSALFREGADSPYANGIVVRQGDEKRPQVRKLLAVLQSQEVKDFLRRKYGTAVLPAFR